jgi:hypothetical protein
MATDPQLTLQALAVPTALVNPLPPLSRDHLPHEVNGKLLHRPLLSIIA